MFPKSSNFKHKPVNTCGTTSVMDHTSNAVNQDISQFVDCFYVHFPACREQLTMIPGCCQHKYKCHDRCSPVLRLYRIANLGCGSYTFDVIPSIEIGGVEVIQPKSRPIDVACKVIRATNIAVLWVSNKVKHKVNIGIYVDALCPYVVFHVDHKLRNEFQLVRIV